MAKVNFRNVKYVTSYLKKEERPFDKKKDVVFLGKSNVGKSSLINSLVSQKIAFSSKKAGKTQLLNYFLVDNRFYIVDAPGYGYTAYGTKKDEVFSEMMESYFVDNQNLSGACMLVDVRRGILENEESMINYLLELKIPILIIYTKCDTVGQKEMNLAKKEAALFKNVPVYYSDKNKDYDDLRKLLVTTFHL